jgi:hypothetical protein
VGSQPPFIVRGEKSDPSYAPSFGYEGTLLTETHGSAYEDVASVDGWLDPADALKLYELGYLLPGPFLEIGTYRGKSTTILTTALRDAGRQVEFYSLDIDGEALQSASATLAARGLGRHVTLVHGSAAALFRALPRLRPRFVFLDGDHSADGLGRDLATLEARVPEGSVLLFHDFLDCRNDDPDEDAYGVPQAIRASWVARDCEFAGVFGCAGLYRRQRGPRAPDDDADPPAVVELMSLDRMALRLRVGVARPALRFIRRQRARLVRRRGG